MCRIKLPVQIVGAMQAAAADSKGSSSFLALCISVMILCSAASHRAVSQVIVEPDVVTDSVDVFVGSEKPLQSRMLASAAALVLPGLGHQFLGNSSRALVYYSAEALFVCGMIFSERYSRRMFNDSKTYAWLYAGAHMSSGAHDYYWQNVGGYMDSDEYNRIMELNRTPENKYSDASWRWIDEFFREEYNNMRETATRFHVVSSFCVAAMVLNRLVSFIDIRRSTKYKGVQGRVSLRFYPTYAFSGAEPGLTAAAEF